MADSSALSKKLAIRTDAMKKFTANLLDSLNQELHRQAGAVAALSEGLGGAEGGGEGLRAAVVAVAAAAAKRVVGERAQALSEEHDAQWKACVKKFASALEIASPQTT